VCSFTTCLIIGKINQPNPPVEIPENSAIVSCIRCKLIFVNPMPFWEPEDFSKLYNADYFTHLHTAEKQNWLHVRKHILPQKRFKKIARHLKAEKKTLLEIGAGENAFMCQYLLKNGWSVTAQEPGEFFHERLRRIDGLAVDTRDVLDLDGQYSLIFADSVLEHVPNPVEYYRKLASLLAPGGVFYTVSPNEISLHNYLLARRAEKSGATPPYIAPYTEPYHLTGFTKKSLQILAEKSGLALASYKKAEDYMAFHALNSAKSPLVKYPLALMYASAQAVGYGTNGEAVFVK